MQTVSFPTIAGVMLASFAATVTYLWWQREPASPAAIAVAPEPIVPAHTRAPVTQVSPAPAPATASMPMPQRAAAPPPESEPVEQPDQDPPLMVNVVPNRAFVPDEQTGGEHRVLKDTFDLIVTNESDRAIEVEVTETKLATLDKSNFAFTLAKGNQRHVTVRDGLPMASGDELTIKAPKFRELTASIP